MRRFPNKFAAEVEEIEAEVWKCTSTDCNGWMRVEFALEKLPKCALCGSEMEKRTKLVPPMEEPSFRNY